MAQGVSGGSSYQQEFVKSWTDRVNQAQAAGVNPAKLKAIIQQDWRRVQNGSSPYNDTQAGLAVHSVLSGKPLINVDNSHTGGGLLGGLTAAIGNIPDDVGSIASGLNPITLLPNLYNQAESAVKNPEQLVKPIETAATGNITGALKQASKTPLLDLIPGVFTAKNVLTGDWDQIIKHPVMTGLDVLPWASAGGKLAMAGRAVEGSAEAADLASAGKLRGTVEPQSPSAALLEGKPLKAAFRAAGGTTDSPLSYRWFRATQDAKAAMADTKPLLYGGLDNAPNGARVVPTDNGSAGFIENPPMPQSFGKTGKGSGAAWVNDVTTRADKAGMPLEVTLNTTHDAAINLYTKQGFEVMRTDGPLTTLRREPVAPKTPTVYRTSDFTARIAEKYGFDYETRELNRLHNILERKKGKLATAAATDYDSWFEGLSPEDRLTVLHAAQRFNPDGLNAEMGAKFTPEMRDIVEHARQHTDELAEPYTYDPWAEAEQRQAHAESKSKEEFAPEGTADRTNKQFIAVPNDGGSVDVYPIDGDVGRAYQKVFEKQRGIDPLQRRLDGAQAKLDAAAEAGEEPTEAMWRAHERAQVKFDSAKKDLTKAQELFDKIHNRAAPARYGELLKDEFKGRLQRTVDDQSGEAVRPMYRRSTQSIERDLQNPQGAFMSQDPRDFEAVTTGETAQHDLRPQMPLDIHVASNTVGLGEGVLEHFGHGDTARVIADRVREGDIKGAIDYAEENLDGVEFTTKERNKLIRDGASPGEMMDIAGAKLARQYGHDAVFKQVNVGDAANPRWVSHEATVLDESALLTKQKSPVLTPDQAAQAGEAINNNNFGYLVDQGILTSGQLHGIMDDVMSGWQELARQGYDPVYVPHVPEAKVGYLLDQKPLAGNLYTPRQFLSKDTLSFQPQAQDMAIAMTSYAHEILKQQASLEMFKAVRAMATTQKQLVERFGLERATRMLSTDYIPYSETAGRFLSKAEMNLLPDSEKLFIPRVLNNNLDHMMNAFDRNPAFGAYDKAMKAYKFAILTGPRHIAHVLFGGLAMMMGEHGVTAFPKFYEALKRVRDGEMPLTIGKGLDTFTPEEWAQMGQGKTMGRLLVKALGSPMRAMKVFEDTIADTQRVMTYLREVDKGAKAGLSTEAAEQAAMKLTNKVYMDIDGMAPLERTVLRHVFPFYSFTKHIIRYVLNYPADHPWRAAMIANIARIEQEDHASGLPSMFNDFLFLGGADKAGNQEAIDVKNLNPFRSLDGQNPLTLAGFMSALSPAFTIPAQLAGLNTLTATPDLYPNLDYDPRTGKLVAAHPDMAQQALQLALPPVGALEGILGLSENWRQLKKSDPDAYNRALMSAMNLPFIPQKRNLGIERGKAEANRYRAAQGALSDALRSGDTSELTRYNVVPFQGNLVSSSVMIRLIERIKQTNPGVSPASVIPRSHGKGSLGAALATVK